MLTNLFNKFIPFSTRFRNLCLAISARKTKNKTWTQRMNTENKENYITKIFITLTLH